MRDHDNLAALIDDAGALADQFCATLPAGGAAGLHAGAPLFVKARAYRDMLFCRFADQVFSAARSARHGRPVSTSRLTRASFETFTHLFELRDHLERGFTRGDLDALDELLTARLFGVAADEQFSLGLAEDEERCEPCRLPVADNDVDEANEEFRGIDPGASTQDTRADLALQRLMRTLIAIETSFDNCFRALEMPMRRLEDIFAPLRTAHS